VGTDAGDLREGAQRPVRRACGPDCFDLARRSPLRIAMDRPTYVDRVATACAVPEARDLAIRLPRSGGPVRARLFYRDEYVCDVLEAGMRHTFDVLRPRRVRDALVECGAATTADFVAPAALTDDDLALVHTAEYLEQIRQPETLARLLFLDPEHPWDDRLLLPFLYAAGGTLEAALSAADGGVGLNLGGGYHHAQADKAEGFCAIADVAIAVRRLQRERHAGRVLIVDLDYHHGNGNAAIFSNDESVFTFSIHANNWCWLTKRHNLDVELPPHTGDDVYLRTVRTHLPAILDTFRPDFVFYVAGSDPFVEDRLGDFDISEAGMLARDRLVTREVRGRGLPLVVVTAGGYGPASWRIHFNYYRALLAGEMGAAA
jgi:acetoin utilization deacetylase AcuC-like enzyme